MRDLNDMALFALIVEAGTFTTAAIWAGLPKSTVSRRLARPEARSVCV
ncbi:MAG TPA: LysR family transcriptional regulator [Candidatus Macondimonas sp.]|nr:LysR family transcriptional regulator [Candidatus Macondimonas sp.]